MVMFAHFEPAKPGDARPRCEQSVQRDGAQEKCGRIGRPRQVSYDGKDFGEMVVCNGHAQQLVNRGFNVRLIDRRRKRS